MPINTQNRRDPQKGKNGFSANKGFTVIELLIAVAVLAIVMSLALPSYRAILEKRQVTSGAEQVMAFLSSAQMEAVKRNQFVAVNYQPNGGDWCFGMTAGDDEDVTCDCRDGSCLLDGAERTIFSSVLTKPEVLDLNGIDFGNADSDKQTILFDPVRGMTVLAESASVQLISPDQESWALNVEMVPTGRVKICADTTRSTKSVPGYKECQ